MSTTIVGLGGRSAIADQVLDHHRAYHRPRVAVAPLAPVVPSVLLGTRAAVRRILLVRVVACVVLWATAGLVVAIGQLSDAPLPRAAPHGVVICAGPGPVGSVPGC